MLLYRCCYVLLLTGALFLLLPLEVCAYFEADPAVAEAGELESDILQNNIFCVGYFVQPLILFRVQIRPIGPVEGTGQDRDIDGWRLLSPPIFLTNSGPFWFVLFLVRSLFGFCSFWFLLFLVCALFGSCCFWFVLFLVCAVFGHALFGLCSFWLVLFLVCALFGSCSFWFVLFLVRALFGSCCFWFMLFLVRAVFG